MTAQAPSNPNGDRVGSALQARRMMGVAAHTLLFAASWFVALGLAYNFKHWDEWVGEFFLLLVGPVVVIKLTFFMLTGMLRASWQYVSLRDVFGAARAAWLSFIVIFLIYYALQNGDLFGLDMRPFDDRFPDSVFLIDFGATIALVVGARMAVRLYAEEARPTPEGGARNLLIVGAGNAAENVVRELQRMPTAQYHVVGFVDDDAGKRGTLIHGREVFGAVERIKSVCDENKVEEILIAMPSASRADLRRVVELCQGTNLRFKTLPSLSDLITGRATVSQIRDVDINDLLGRAPVQLDDAEIAKFIRGRAVMVTGAGGSIGSEMCRQIARFAPRRLVLVEQSEHPLFEIDRELRRTLPGLDLAPYICDIADRGRVERIFAAERPTAVFHAAAHKHVPMMELNPGEALKNNVHGTRTIADAAVRAGCEKFVMISTDKAVNPTSIMGCSKRVAEMYIQALSARSGTQFVTVRFGNVLGSSGSVIPIFKEQIARGGPVTVTHPDMVRYFMTIPEAAQLVLQSASMGRGGEIFVLDMGDPVKIVDLAREMITLSGFRPDDEIAIVFSGVRPGEKLYEELAIEGEDVSRTAHPKIGIWQNIAQDYEEISQRIDALLSDADGLSREAVRARLKQMVPEFYLEPPATRAEGFAGRSPAAKEVALTDGADAESAHPAAVL